jgi:hypothetical protein
MNDCYACRMQQSALTHPLDKLDVFADQVSRGQLVGLLTIEIYIKR